MPAKLVQGCQEGSFIICFHLRHVPETPLQRNDWPRLQFHFCGHGNWHRRWLQLQLAWGRGTVERSRSSGGHMTWGDESRMTLSMCNVQGATGVSMWRWRGRLTTGECGTRCRSPARTSPSSSCCLPASTRCHPAQLDPLTLCLHKSCSPWDMHGTLLPSF